jgi:hypothetical protein
MEATHFWFRPWVTASWELRITLQTLTACGLEELLKQDINLNQHVLHLSHERCGMLGLVTGSVMQDATNTHVCSQGLELHSTK